MNSKSLTSLFKSVNRGHVNLIDSLSVLTALTELTHVGSEEEFHTEVLRIVLENQDVEHCALFLHKQGKLKLQATGAWGNTSVITRQRKAEWEKYDMSFEHGAIGQAVSSRKILSKQCEQLPGFFIQLHEDAVDQHDVVGNRAQMSSMMCVPLVNDDRVYGVLCLHHCKSEYFNTGHEHFFSLLAKFFVQILLNFRYTHNLEDQVKERTEQLEDALKVARKLQRDFRNLSLIDEQTGLPNRRFFCDQSQTAISRAARYQRAFSCCIIEIKHISNVSSKDGLLAEDQRLQALADILKMQVREADILAHLRGDQFIMSLPESDAAAAMEFAERIKNILLETGKKIDLFESIQLHIGLSTLDADIPASSELALKELMTCADRAMRASKNLGKNICHFYDLNGHDLDISLIS